MGIERKEAYVCTSCDTAHTELNEAFACCGVTVNVSGELRIEFSFEVEITSESQYEDMKNYCGDDMRIDVEAPDGTQCDASIIDYSADVEFDDEVEV